MKNVGQAIFAFFGDYLKTQKGLRPGWFEPIGTL